MPCDVFPPRLLLLLFLSAVFGASRGCLPDPASAYRFTGTVCRLTYPAAVVLNEKTTKVIEAAFQHARYPSMKGEKSVLIGKVLYGLDNLEIHNLSIGRSEFELHPGKGIGMEISNVSASFSGTIQYGYTSWLGDVSQSVDFEIESQTDLGINPKLYCGKGQVAADTSDCYLNFHKLSLHLHGNKEPNWLKKLFTDFVTFTVKMVIKGQGLTKYNNTVAVIDDSVFHPSQLTENRMLYFWVSDQVFGPMIKAAHQDGRFQLNMSGAELTELFKTNLTSAMPEFIRKCLETASPELRVWSVHPPFINTSSDWGTSVFATASGQLLCGSEDTPTLTFVTDVVVDVTASYADKKLFLRGKPSDISVTEAMLPSQNHRLIDETQTEFVREAVEKIGIPKVLSVLEVVITRLLNRQGVDLFDIVNPVVTPRDGYVVIEMDFGFPHHLLVDFLRKTLQ
ncbi:Cholesteryl ester transfer protein [Collichthys lucidus]|uniref:Cholesteryl ester transfer protein n=1 Tax=Collichthys lucidus TaxID=240159 RepID=A0A4U5UFW4_COLLU|nr:Cholesteryl ester transfer protein [Collichthys lucidus]